MTNQGNERPQTSSVGHSAEKDAPCRLGYEEHDGSAYCHEHGRFVAYAAGSRSCRDTDRRRRVTSPGE